MKKLQKKYKKKLIQKQDFKINIHRNKHELYFYDNLIGFYNEYFSLSDNDFKYNICNYNHTSYHDNHKLYKKYPPGISKTYYKEWLKENYT